MLRVTDCKLLSWDLKQGIQLQNLGSHGEPHLPLCLSHLSSGCHPPVNIYSPPLSCVLSSSLAMLYGELPVLNFCFFPWRTLFLICTCQRSSRPSSNALDTTSYPESLSFLSCDSFPEGASCFQRRWMLPGPL